VNFRGGFAVESAQQAVQRSRPARFAGGESVAQSLIARGPFEKSIEQGPQVKTGTAGNDREPSSGRYVSDSESGKAGVLAGGKDFVGVNDIEKVVRNAAAFRGRKFSRSDIEVAIDLQRVAINNFAAEGVSYFERECAFSRSCWPGDRNQRRLGRVTG